jgi:hypothetical protein
MPKQRVTALGDLVGVATTPAVDISANEESDLYINGTWVGTVQPEVSADGTNFNAVGSALTAPAIVALPKTAKQVRLDCTAFTSGTIESQVGGRDDDRLG